MRAARLTGNSSSTIVEIEPPEPGPGEVRVRVEGSGVCPSNLPVWEGRPWFTYPLEPGAPGHEGWGTVDRVGRGADASLLGRRVAFLSARSYAEWDVAEARQIVVIPEELRTTPCPGEPVACAVNVFRRAAIRRGETVAVVGVGFLGAMLVRLAADAGADVIAISRRPFALDLARTCGAALTLPLDGTCDVEAAVHDRTGGRMADCAIEAVGLQSTLDLATALTGTRARLVIAGYHQDGTRQVNMQLWNWRGLDVINAHERDPAVYLEGLREGLELLRSGRLDLAPLITHALPLHGLDEAFRLMIERPDGFVKAIVTMGKP